MSVTKNRIVIALLCLGSGLQASDIRSDEVRGASALTTLGAVPFVTATIGVVTQDGVNFVWDNTNKRLGIGTATPRTKLDVTGTGRFSDVLTVQRANWLNGAEGGCATAADLLVHAVTNTIVTSATYPFVAADVNGRLQVVSGAGWTPGDYIIVSVAAGAATLDRSPAPVTTPNGTFTVNRGRVVLVEGALGVAADTFRVCTADAAGAMAYRALY